MIAQFIQLINLCAIVTVKLDYCPGIIQSWDVPLLPVLAVTGLVFFYRCRIGSSTWCTAKHCPIGRVPKPCYPIWMSEPQYFFCLPKEIRGHICWIVTLLKSKSDHLITLPWHTLFVCHYKGPWTSMKTMNLCKPVLRCQKKETINLTFKWVESYYYYCITAVAYAPSCETGSIMCNHE